MTPIGTETVFALGCGQNVVGVSDFCDYPPQAKSKPHRGGAINPNFERLTALKPDLVIVLGQNEKITEFCRRKNIGVLKISMADLEELFTDLKKMGQVLGCPEQAEKLSNQIRTDLQKVREKWSGQNKPKVFLSMYRTTGSLEGISTVGGNTCLSELLSIAGGENIFADLPLPYPIISKETLLKRQPDIIIEPHPSQLLANTNHSDLLADWQPLASIPAVANNRIYFIPDDIVLKPGPRVAQIAEILFNIIHPNIGTNGADR
jgi:iron complex transport system substrate-binding protein